MKCLVLAALLSITYSLSFGAVIGHDNANQELFMYQQKLNVLYNLLDAKCPDYIGKKQLESERTIPVHIKVAKELYSKLVDKYVECEARKAGETTKSQLRNTTPKAASTSAKAVTTERSLTSTRGSIPVSTTAKPTSGQVRDIRLPRWLVPLSYEVEIKPDIYQLDSNHFSNSGNVSVLMDCVETTSTISMHINRLWITSYSLREEGGAEISTPNAPAYDGDRQFVNFSLNAPLTVGKQYRLTMAYSGSLKDSLSGLYYSTYNAGNATHPDTRYFAVTQFQPTDARTAFPCFDEPALKANFTISLWRKTGYTALSNMPLQSSHNVGNGWIKDTFQQTVKISTYLLAMIVCDFRYKETITAGGVAVRVWSRESAIDQVDFALSQGHDLLTYYEHFFNVPYVLPKLDMIAIPDFAAGAMENWGLITYRETALLYNSQVPAASDKQRVAVVVSHELSHQWFGNLVTPSWWDDLWFNEGFATYLEYIGVNHTEPDWQMMDQFVTSDVQGTLRADSLATSHPIYVEVQHPDEINEIFDSISYGKGGSLMRMMRYFLGEATFTEALSNYIDSKKYKAAHHSDFWQAMQDEADRRGIKDDRGNALDVKGILDTWTKQMGYPLLDVQSNPSTGNGKDLLTIKQSHFLQDDSQEPDPKYPSPFGYKWDVPVSYVTNKDPNFDVDETSVKWFYKEDASLNVEIDSDCTWFIVNPKQYGFYRVNYPEPYWQKLIDTQAANHLEIDELSRSQTIDDAFNLVLAGKLRITYAMELTKYLVKEESYFAWDAAIGSLSYVSAALESTSAYGDFKSYYKGLIEPYYNKFNGSWVFDSNAPIIEQYRQSAAIGRACSYDVGDCRIRSQTLLKNWMDTGTNDIHPNVRSIVYCYGVKAGAEAEWDFVYDRYINENAASEKMKLLQALGCSEKLWQLQRLLDYVMDQVKMSTVDSHYAVDSVSKSQLHADAVWDWLRANWQQLSQGFPVHSFVTSATRSFYTQNDLDMIEAFAAEKGDLGIATRAFTQAKEKTQNNIKYLERNQAALTKWLSDNVIP